MLPTHLLYLEQNNLSLCSSTVRAVFEENGRSIVILDQTVFYPQGGGQPCDHGIIEGAQDVRFNVDDVRNIDGIVHHYGTFYHGTFFIDNEVICRIDEERRKLMSCIHSAGHVIDMAVAVLGLLWRSGRGFHFAEGPYVEYFGSLGDQDKEALKEKIEKECNLFIAQKLPATFAFAEQETVAGKQTRIVAFGHYGIPCGGTHVQDLSEIGHMVIRALKIKGDTIRISYAVT